MQRSLARRVRLKPLPRRIDLIAGADVCFSSEREQFFAAVVLMTFPGLDTVEVVSARHRPTFPYVPGLLSFREGPVLLEALAKLRQAPELVLFDGQGLAHPRRLGLASHLGLWLQIPTVGVAKSRLCGKHLQPGRLRGQSVPLLDAGEKIGEVLRSKDGVKPLYLSPGHLSDFETCTGLVLRCCRGYRLPEPTRLADIEVARRKKEWLAKTAKPREGP